MTPTTQQLARLCDIAYGDSPANLDWFRNEYRLREGNTEALCGTVGSDIVIAFRGSSSVPDWLTNANARLEHVGGGRHVHAGFMAAAMSAMGDVNRFLNNHLSEESSVHFTGHSLGGALAVIVGAAQKSFGRNVASITTFGCPRVGDAEFVKALPQHLITQWVKINDPVPRMPPRLIGYRHAAKDQFIDGTGEKVSLDTMDDPVSAHRIGGYGNGA
jgi:hypothetical protein